MKILFIATTFNGMVQRAWVELDRRNHQIKVHLANDNALMEAVVEAFAPELIIAPYLKSPIPESIWSKYICLVIHPGIPGDRGSSSLDWAILRGEKEWGVTILQAVEKMDAGPVWAYEYFEMRNVSKSCLYRHEVTNTAIRTLLTAVEHFQQQDFRPEVPDHSNPAIQGRWNRPTRQNDYHFSWTDMTADICRKINAADSHPGVLSTILNEAYYLYGVCEEGILNGHPGEIIAKRNKAICIATGDGAIWLKQLKHKNPISIKLPATLALGAKADSITENKLDPFTNSNQATFAEIRFEKIDQAGFIHFDFYNGAMDKDQCHMLRETIVEAKKRNIKVIVLMGGYDLWSNGIHLNVIENADHPADESWQNINAMNDLILEIIDSPNHYMITALQGTAGAGGVALAVAGDKVIARQGIVLNPHTRNMGLHGSEYWTYLLPRKIGIDKAIKFTTECLPWGTDVAKEIGLIDHVEGESVDEFLKAVQRIASQIANLEYFDKLMQAKNLQRRKDERIKPLAKYREEELHKMHANFYDNDEGYREKRFRFIHKITDLDKEEAIEAKDLYSSRRKIYRRRKSESIEYK